MCYFGNFVELVQEFPSCYGASNHPPLSLSWERDTGGWLTTPEDSGALDSGAPTVNIHHRWWQWQCGNGRCTLLNSSNTGTPTSNTDKAPSQFRVACDMLSSLNTGLTAWRSSVSYTKCQSIRYFTINGKSERVGNLTQVNSTQTTVTTITARVFGLSKRCT